MYVRHSKVLSKFSRLSLLSFVFCVLPVFAEPEADVTEVNTSLNSIQAPLAADEIPRAAPPETAKSTEEKSITALSGFLKKLSHDSKFQESMKAAQKSNNSRDYFTHTAYLAPYDPARPDQLEAYSIVAKRSSDVMARDAVTQVPFLVALSGGYDFNLDFSKFFAPSTTRSAPTKSGRGAPRYGLILKKIEPSTPRRTTAQAALRPATRASELDRGNSELATMHWTIGPQYEPHGDTRVFQPSMVEDYVSNYDVYTLGVNGRADDGEVFWLNGAIPKPVLRTNIKPADDKVLRESLSGQAASTPRLKITLTQEQGLYEWGMSLNDGGKKKNITEHQFRLPIFGTMSVARRYDDKFQPVLTSVSNILVYSTLPSVTLSQRDQNGQILTETKYGDEKKGQIFFNTRSDAKVEEKLRTKSENMKTYEVGYKCIL